MPLLPNGLNLLLASCCASRYFFFTNKARTLSMYGLAAESTVLLGPPPHIVDSFNWRRSCRTPPNTIAAICPLPIGSASFQLAAGLSYHNKFLLCAKMLVLNNSRQATATVCKYLGFIIWFCRVSYKFTKVVIFKQSKALFIMFFHNSLCRFTISGSVGQVV